MANPMLIEKFHSEIIVGCEAGSCHTAFVPTEPPCEPVEQWALRAAGEAEQQGWSTSPDARVLCPKCSKAVKSLLPQSSHPEIEGLRREVVSTSRALVHRSLPFLLGVRKLASLRFQIPGEVDNPDFLLFAGVASEADHVPEESVRASCSSTWLAQCDKEVKELKEHYEKPVLAACMRIVERYAPVA
jgi:hypothetical protein